MRSLVIILSFIFCFCCCSQNNKQEFYKEVPVAVNQVEVPDGLSLFQLEFACDSFILATNLSPTHKIVKISTREVVPFVTVGRGPMEVMVPWFKAKEDTLYVLSTDPYGLKELITIPMASIENKEMWEIETLKTDTPMYTGSSFDLDEQNNLILIGGNKMEETNIVTYINRQTQERVPLGFWPEDDYDGPSIPKFNIYAVSSDLFYNRQIGKYLYVCGEGAYASILKHKDGCLQEDYVLLNEKPRYGALSDGLNWSREDNSRLGVYSFATDSLIYLAPTTHHLVNHEYVPDNYKGYPPYFVDHIHVYDWEGNYKHTYVTDKPFISMFVSEDDSKMYLLSNDRETMYSEIFTFNM